MEQTVTVAAPASSPWQPVDLEQLLKVPAQKMGGLAMLKTRYRPYICPLEWVLSEIPERARLYDVGCGTGALLYLALKLRSAETAHGYDVAEAAVENARYFREETGEAFQVNYLPIAQTPPDVSAYDTVCMIDVLHHIPPPMQQEFLNRLTASMPPGSRLIFKDIDAAKPFGRWMNQLHDIVLAREWVHPRSRLDTVKMLEAAGLQVQRHETRWTWWYPHFLVVATKP